MRKPLRDLSRQTNFGSLAAAHQQFKTSLALRATQEAAEEEAHARNGVPGRPSVSEMERIAHLFSQAENFRDIITDEQARQIQAAGGGIRQLAAQTPHHSEGTSLPAVFNRSLICAQGEFVPQWQLVRNLPGYMQQPIRAVGRRALASFTRTDMEEIRLTGTKICEEYQVREIMAWIANNGKYIAQPDKELMTFADIFNPDTQAPYEAQVRLYEANGVDFLIVRDDYGHYIYSWPTRDRLGLDLTLIEAQDHDLEIEAQPVQPGLR